MGAQTSYAGGQQISPGLSPLPAEGSSQDERTVTPNWGQRHAASGPRSETGIPSDLHPDESRSPAHFVSSGRPTLALARAGPSLCAHGRRTRLVQVRWCWSRSIASRPHPTTRGTSPARHSRAGSSTAARRDRKRGSGYRATWLRTAYVSAQVALQSRLETQRMI